MSETAEYLRKEGYPEIARQYEHMKKYGHLTLPQTAELLDRYETALLEIRRRLVEMPGVTCGMADVIDHALPSVSAPTGGPNGNNN